MTAPALPGLRVVARTVIPRCLARTAVASPTEEVPPRIRMDCPAGVQARGQRPVGGLQHFGDGAERGPVQVAAERDDLGGRDAGVLRVPAVKDPAHAAHHRGDLLPGRELPAGASGDDPGRFDAGHPGERDALRQAEPGCSSERLSPNALTLMSTQPADGTGTGSSRMARADGGPGASRTTARMVPVIGRVLRIRHP